MRPEADRGLPRCHISDVYLRKRKGNPVLMQAQARSLPSIWCDFDLGGSLSLPSISVISLSSVELGDLPLSSSSVVLRSGALLIHYREADKIEPKWRSRGSSKPVKSPQYKSNQRREINLGYNSYKSVVLKSSLRHCCALHATRTWNPLQLKPRAGLFKRAKWVMGHGLPHSKLDLAKASLALAQNGRPRVCFWRRRPLLNQPRADRVQRPQAPARRGPPEAETASRLATRVVSRAPAQELALSLHLLKRIDGQVQMGPELTRRRVRHVARHAHAVTKILHTDPGRLGVLHMSGEVGTDGLGVVLACQ